MKERCRSCGAVALVRHEAGDVDVTDLSEGPDIHLRVDLSRADHRVAEVIADLLQRKALAEQVRGVGVTKPVWAVSLECLAEAQLGDAHLRRKTTARQGSIG